MTPSPILRFCLFAALSLGGKFLFAHAGHDEAPGEESASRGPVTLSEEAVKNLDIRKAEAVIRAIEKTIKASGAVQAIPGSRENVSSKIEGRVAELKASLGQFRKKGETLLILESRQLAETPARVAVTAPRDGKVVKINVIKGDAVEVGASLLEIAAYGEVYAVARVYESHIGKIHKGMSGRVYSPALKNQEMDSKVEFIGSEVNPLSRTVDVWMRVRNRNEQLKINMNVNVHFLADKEDESIVVPKSAVLGSGGERFVFTVEGNGYTRTSVVTGIENDKWIEIIEGVAPGDSVVTQGNYQLQFAKPKPSSDGHSAKAE